MMRKALFTLLAMLLCLVPLSGTVRAEAIRELVTLHGAMSMPLTGIGIVTGLANTGDKKDAALTMLRKYMSNNNIDFDVSSLATGNIAIVQVNAEFPPFARVGSRFPITVTSIGDAKSLEGGQLIGCELSDSEGVVAFATGRVITGSGILTRGTVSPGENSGAMALIPYPYGKVVNEEGFIRLNLNRPNWADASTIARQINQAPSLNPNLRDTEMFAEEQASAPVAWAKDAGQVLVRIPEQFRAPFTDYVRSILDLPVTVNRPATILVNRSRNSIVVTGDIRVNNAMVSLQDKTVTVRPETPEEPAMYTLQNESPRNLVELEGPGSYADLQGLIDTLNAMGLTTDQVITLFEQLRASGAINAEFINQ